MLIHTPINGAESTLRPHIDPPEGPKSWVYGRLRSTSAQLTDAAAHMVGMDEITVSRLMTTKELSAYLQIPERTLEDWCTSRIGRGPRPIRLGKRVRYRLSTVDAWLESLEAEGFDADQGAA